MHCSVESKKVWYWKIEIVIRKETGGPWETGIRKWHAGKSQQPTREKEMDSGGNPFIPKPKRIRNIWHFLPLITSNSLFVVVVVVVRCMPLKYGDCFSSCKTRVWTKTASWIFSTVPAWSTQRPRRWLKKPWNETGPSNQGRTGKVTEICGSSQLLEISPQNIHGDEGD